MLKKISGPKGSVEGGWYIDTDTGLEYYVKFYDDPLNTQMEYFANLIYVKAGILVPEKRIGEIDGKLAIISKKVGKGDRASREEQRGHPDMISGFVADAYLNNWDVTGDAFDNIVKDEHGRLYRVDNGGVGVIRANGGRKHFAQDSVPELNDMRDLKYQAGYVFRGIEESEIGQQARKFLDNVSEKFIREALELLDLNGEDMKETLGGFLGRRLYLAQKYDNIVA